ncbi:MAG TPA: HIT family protein [Gemmatimonadales bacterium]|nr:HIT family protein [Gemmatimonadales bacterium]
MTSWHDPEHWRGLLDGSACPICIRGEPLDIIATLPATWLTMTDRAPMVGYVCLVSRIHAVELHDLDETEACAFMRDARTVSRALQAVTGAVKLNYAMHGNVLPHLHMHLFPRHRGDAFEGRVVDPGAIHPPVYTAGAFEAMRGELQRVLG